MLSAFLHAKIQAILHEIPNCSFSYYSTQCSLVLYSSGHVVRPCHLWFWAEFALCKLLTQSQRLAYCWQLFGVIKSIYFSKALHFRGKIAGTFLHFWQYSTVPCTLLSIICSVFTEIVSFSNVHFVRICALESLYKALSTPVPLEDHVIMNKLW